MGAGVAPKGGRPTRAVLPPLKWRESPNSSPRLAPVRLVVVHRPVGSYAGSIEALCNPTHEASAHVIVREDGREATQLVKWDRKAWACVSFNSASDNIETPDWIWEDVKMDAKRTAERLRVMRICAHIVAFRLHVRGFPAHYLTGTHLLNAKGFTRHYDLGAAGGGHEDPTTDTTRWFQFVHMVEEELARGGFRKTWGK